VAAYNQPEMNGWMATDRTGTSGKPLLPDPVTSTQVTPAFVVRHRASGEKPPNATYTVCESDGSMAIEVTFRFGSPPSTLIQPGDPDVPLNVMNTSPLPYPTQMTSELPAATAIAATFVVAVELLITVHTGPVVAVFGV